jgi:hypothetical protein
MNKNADNVKNKHYTSAICGTAVIFFFVILFLSFRKIFNFYRLKAVSTRIKLQKVDQIIEKLILIRNFEYFNEQPFILRLKSRFSDNLKEELKSLINFDNIQEIVDKLSENKEKTIKIKEFDQFIKIIESSADAEITALNWNYFFNSESSKLMKPRDLK